MRTLSCGLIAAAALLGWIARVAGDDTQPNSPAPTASEAAAEPAPPTPKQTEYKPPFPEREELFQPPNFKGLSKSQRDEVRLEVVLKGFADVDAMRVLLSLNGQMASLTVGESHLGVEVISIQPPQVTLQRGRVRWTETLYANEQGQRNGRNRSAPAKNE